MRDITDKHLAGLNAASEKLKAAFDAAIVDYNMAVTALETERVADMEHRIRAFHGEIESVIPIRAPREMPSVARLEILAQSDEDDEFLPLPRILNRGG